MFSRRRQQRTAARNEIDTARSRFGSKNGAPVNGSDLLIPSAFTASATLPDVDALRQQLFAYIDEGTRSGAFDEGSAAYADQWLHEKYATWVQLLDVEFQHRSDSAAWIVGGRVENLTVSFAVLREQEARLAQLDADLASCRAELSGVVEQEDSKPPASTSTSVHAELADLPRPTQLAGLELIPSTEASDNAAIISIHPESRTIRAVDDNAGN